MTGKITRRAAVNRAKTAIAENIQKLFSENELEAVICDDDPRVVKIRLAINYEDYGETITDLIELEVYIKEVQA